VGIPVDVMFEYGTGIGLLAGFVSGLSFFGGCSGIGYFRSKKYKEKMKKRHEESLERHKEKLESFSQNIMTSKKIYDIDFIRDYLQLAPNDLLENKIPSTKFILTYKGEVAPK